MVDLLKKGNLSPKDITEIATRLHYAALEQIFRVSDWRVGDAVFQGGTSLKVAWNSPRFSEDLDFMISAEQMPQLDRIMKRLVGKVRAALAHDLAGSDFRLKGACNPDNRLQRYEIVWSHPNKRGKVSVKLEFLETPRSKLVLYPTRIAIPMPEPETKVTINTPIPVPELMGSFSDKMVALAKREYHKARDVYDVAFITDHLSRSGVDLSEEAYDRMARTAMNVASIYHYTPESIIAGLERYLEKPESRDVQALDNDMRRWLDPQLHAALTHNNEFSRMLETTRAQVISMVAALNRLDRRGELDRWRTPPACEDGLRRSAPPPEPQAPLYEGDEPDLTSPAAA